MNLKRTVITGLLLLLASAGAYYLGTLSGQVENSKAIAIDPVTIQNMALRTAVLTNGPLNRTIRTVAAIEPDETLQADVTTKFMGWVEKLYVDSTGEQVHRNDPLLDIYSPELYSAQIDGFVLQKSVVEGQMVSPGKPLYRIADLGLVWVQARIYEQDLPFISLGQEAQVTLSYLPDRQFRGRVTYI